jgi:hypothetical protein
VTSIGDDAFSDSGLTTIIIHAGVNMGAEVFYNCANLESASIDSNTNENMFTGCDGLTSIIIDSNVTTIGNFAFTGCSSLTVLEFSTSIEIIGEAAFINCSNLVSLTFNGSAPSLGVDAFSGVDEDATVYYYNGYGWTLGETFGGLPTSCIDCT